MSDDQDSVISAYTEDDYYKSDSEERSSEYETDYEEDGDSLDEEGNPIPHKVYRKKIIRSWNKNQPLEEPILMDLKMTFYKIPKRVDDGWGSALREKDSMIEQSQPQQQLLPAQASPVKSTTTIWKPIDKNIPISDPWAFLEKKPMPPPSSRSSRFQQQQQSQRPISLLNPPNASSPSLLLPPSSLAESNKLCKYKDSCRMRRDGNCSMVHSLKEWKPKICRFDKSCSKKTFCGYHHTNVQIREYLATMIKKKDSLYFKNANLYQHYLS